MVMTDSIQWHINEVRYGLTREAECKDVLIYQRGDNLPQFLKVGEAAALCVQIRRMLNKSEFLVVSKGRTDNKKDT